MSFPNQLSASWGCPTEPAVHALVLGYAGTLYNRASATQSSQGGSDREKAQCSVSQCAPWSGISYTRNLPTLLDSIPLLQLSAESTLNKKNDFLFDRLYTIAGTM